MAREAAVTAVQACLELADDPYPPGKKMKRLEGTAEPTFRVRFGDYRILYRVNDRERRVFVLRIVNRRDLFKGIKGLPKL
jgi:mRNA interferase RelE/StbE